MAEKYTYDKICKIFNSSIPRSTFNSFIEKKVFPPHKVEEKAREKDGESKILARYWELGQLPEMGRILGFLKKKNGDMFFKQKNSATVITSYTRKGGVLKSTLAYNVARIAALNGYNTLIIGLDSQCDITTMMGYYKDLENASTTEEASSILKNKFGLYDLINPKNPKKLSELIQPTDLPTLYFIPETDELEELLEELERATFREEWLKRNIIEKLKSKFDLIIFDSSPTSGRLVSNAMVVSDLILSPLECSTNNFKNYARTRIKITKKLQELGAQDILIKHVPTKLRNTHISKEIFQEYQKIPACSTHGIKTSELMESSVYNGVSIIEYDPTSEPSTTMRDLVYEIFSEIDTHQSKQSTMATKSTSSHQEEIRHSLMV